MLFAPWFDVTISLLKIKNTELSDHSGVHMSTISRLRHGERILLPDSQQYENLMNSLFYLIRKQNKTDQLKNLLADYLLQFTKQVFPVNHQTENEQTPSQKQQTATEKTPFQKHKTAAEQTPSQKHKTATEQALLEKHKITAAESLSEDQKTASKLLEQLNNENLTEIELYDIVIEIGKLLISIDLREKKKEKTKYLHLFSKRLDYIMQLYQVSNSSLANVLKIDSSLISRWRNGVRHPQENHPAIQEIATYFAKIIPSSNLPAQEKFTKFLASYPGNTLYSQLYYWFTESENKQPLLEEKLTRLLREINQYLMPKRAEEILDLEYVKQLLTANRQQTYHHISGMREAIFRFLSEIIISDTTHTLLLFSNQKMDWLSEDHRFMAIWETLMYTLLSQGHQIEIIHSFGRSNQEIAIALEKWLPLYLKGNITPYSCDLLNLYGKNHYPIAKTLFIDTDHSAISATFIKGNEENVDYHYYTSELKLTELSEEFRQLRDMSEPIFPLIQSSNQFLDSLLKELEKLVKTDVSKEKFKSIKANLKQLKQRIDKLCH